MNAEDLKRKIVDSERLLSELETSIAVVTNLCDVIATEIDSTSKAISATNQTDDITRLLVDCINSIREKSNQFPSEMRNRYYRESGRLEALKEISEQTSESNEPFSSFGRVISEFDSPKVRN